MAGKNVLITGAAGFIGSHLVRDQLARGNVVWGVDNLLSGTQTNVQPYLQYPSFRFDKADMRSWPKLQEAVAWSDSIFHMAAVVGQKHVIAQPIETLANNVRSTEVLLEAMCHTQKNTRLLLASTSSVYWYLDIDSSLADEEVSLKFPSNNYLQSNYPLSKFFSEAMALSYLNKKGIDCTIVRIFNTIGPNQSSYYGMVVPTFIEQALRNDPLTIFGTGLQTRSFCDVRDMVTILNLLIDIPETRGQIFNVGDDRECSIIDLAKLIIEKANSPSIIQFLSYKEAYGIDFKDLQRRKPNLNKFRSLTGFKPQWTLSETLEDILKSYGN